MSAAPGRPVLTPRSLHAPPGGDTVGALARQVPPVGPEVRSELARERFAADDSLLALPVVATDGSVHGILNRFRFLERFSAPFGRELAARKPVATFLERGLVLDENTPVEDVGDQLIAEPRRFLFDGFLVTAGGRYVGVATAFDLFRAVTERRHAELHHRASHDALTGLPNRSVFEQRLGGAVAAATAAAQSAVLFIDLDRFKEVNDSFGHRFGDLVLTHVAARLRAALRHGDMVARLSGDEFAVLVEAVQVPADACRIAEAVVAACSAPMNVAGQDVTMSCSVGVALCPAHASTADELMRASDSALYGAKEVRNRYQLYEAEVHALRVPVRAAALRQALDRGELDVHFQPVVSLSTGRIGGAEALVRWTHPEAGPVPANQIVQLAEDSGLIVPLGAYVANVALAQLARWDAAFPDSCLHMAMNVSALQVSEGSLVKWLDGLVTRTGVRPDRIELEFTETGALRVGAAVDRAFQDLHDRGFVLAIDDFGIGYSALSRLERLPVDVVKIDRSFVQAIGTPRRGGTIAQAIIAMGRALGLTVVAEGVETEQQRDFLASAGCHAAQGYLLGRPMPGDAFALLLSAEAHLPPAGRRWPQPS